MGCSWVYRGMIYVPDTTPAGWIATSTPAGPFTKHGRVPEQIKLTYAHDKFDLSVQSQYRDILWRPWFAVLFRFEPDERDVFLHLWIRITRKENLLEIDPLKWIVIINDEKKALTPELKNQADYQGTEYFTVKYNVKVDTVQRMRIQFEGIKSGGEEIHIPDLELTKKKGRLICDRFNLS